MSDQPPSLPPGPPPYSPPPYGPPPGSPPPPFQPQPYQPQPPYGAGVVSVAHNNQKAIASMVCGIFGLPLSCCCFPVGLILGAVALFLGIISQKEIATSGGSQSGAPMAIAGLVMGGISLLLGVGLLVYFIIGIASGASHGFSPVVPSR